MYDSLPVLCYCGVCPAHTGYDTYTDEPTIDRRCRAACKVS
jgi:hypothetical protein